MGEWLAERKWILIISAAVVAIIAWVFIDEVTNSFKPPENLVTYEEMTDNYGVSTGLIENNRLKHAREIFTILKNLKESSGKETVKGIDLKMINLDHMVIEAPPWGYIRRSPVKVRMSIPEYGDNKSMDYIFERNWIGRWELIWVGF
jgi:hypothetical protein